MTLRLDPNRPSRSGQAPPRLADWLLSRVLPMGKRGESIRGDLVEEFHHQQSQVWYWQQTLRLTLRYLFSPSPQDTLTYPRRAGMWFDLADDVKGAFRNIRRAPGTSALIVLTLAFAIGAATIGFTFADLALLRGLPVDDPSKVVSVFANDQQGSNPRARVSGPDFLDYVARSTTLEKMAVMRDSRAPLIRNGQSRTVNVTLATADLLASMGQTAQRGRTFMLGDDRPGAAPVTLLADHFWRAEFQGRDDVIGRTLQLGRDHFTVVGVLEPEIEFGSIAEVDVWLPLRVDPQGPRDARNLRLLARLKDGVTFEQAASELSAIGAALANEHPRTNGGWTIRLVPVNDLIGGDGFWVVIALFLLSIGLLMAIATANVSNLVMVRTIARARELAVRAALGARKGRIVRQFVTEGMVLSLLAAGLSLPVAWAGLRAIVAISAEEVFQQLVIDGHELAFIAILALICPVVFSISPIRMLSRPDMRHVLAASGGRGTTASIKGRSLLVVVQVALAVILLTVSSLALRSIRQLYAAPTGMATADLLVFGLDLNDASYPTAELSAAAALATRAELLKLPGVEFASMMSGLPILGDQMPRALTVDNDVPIVKEAQPTAVVTGISHDAGRALGLSLLAGEWWAAEGADGADGADGLTVAVISGAAARRYFGGVEQAIGRFVTVSQDDRLIRARVIGVSSDVANTDRTVSPPARVWLPLDPGARRFAYVVKAQNPAALSSSVRTVVATHAPAVPIEYLMTFDAALEQAASSDYAVIGMLAGFALLALVLASTGLFGVVSYGVAQRTSEFGTRMALGARAVDVVRLVAKESVVLLAIGLGIGLAGGIGIAFAMQSVLYELSPTDPVSIATVIALLSLVTMTATALPAWKAARIDPVIALRAE
jgi:putative ABC transport system permease protein